MSRKINTRSPFFIKVEHDSLATAELSLYIYSGIKSTDKPTLAEYSISKSEIGGNNFVVFEISELVRDYINIGFNQERTLDAYIARVEADGGVFESNSLLTNFSLLLDDDYSSGTVWVEADVEIFNSAGALVDTRYFDYVAFDGYSYFEEGANAELSRTLLQSNTDIYYKSGDIVQVPVFSDEVTAVKFYNGSTLHTTVNVSPSTSSTSQIVYASSANATTKIEVISGIVETINVYETDECKYQPQKITFVNKFGALQDIYFFKKSIDTIEVKKDSYNASIFDPFSLSYDLQQHQHRIFNKNAKESVSLNTGYISEQYNSVIKELLLSELVWAEKDGNILPVNLKSESLTFKTRLNDKLINYTLDIEYAFDKINNIK